MYKYSKKKKKTKNRIYINIFQQFNICIFVFVDLIILEGKFVLCISALLPPVPQGNLAIVLKVLKAFTIILAADNCQPVVEFMTS